jgi:hypothetical protein
MTNDSTLTKAKEHTHKLILNKDIQKKVHGDNPIGWINTYLAVKITQIVGSMWCAYVFVLLTLISLPAAIASHNTIVIVSWIAQTFLQLVLLPIIIVGQNVQATASDERAKHDHDTLNAIHTLASEIYRINERQNIILDLLKRKNK